jgi:hypothetical protein
MKRNLLTILFCMVAAITFSNRGSAQLTLIEYWNFNSLSGTMCKMYTPTVNPIPADYTDLPAYHAAILYTTLPGVSASFSSYIDTLTAETAEEDYDTVNARMGAAEGYMVRARNPSDSMQLLFYIPTRHFYNIVMKYGTESSSSTHGMIHQVYSYSIDSGATWITSGGISPSSFTNDSVNGTTDTFRLATVNFTDPATYNNPKLVFRITFVGNNTGISGNNRFDNVTVEGDTISNSTGINSIAAPSGYTLYPNPVTNQLDINSIVDGSKSVTITNVSGQVVYTGSQAGTHFTINTTSLASGIYSVTIQENKTGAINTMKFTKQ